MSIDDMLVDAALKHGVITFMDGHFGYNQIFMAVKDVCKMTFKCLGALGIYEWLVMSFGLNNVDAPYP